MVGSTPEGLDVLLHTSGAPAFLPVTHLSDNRSNCEALLSVYKPSTRLTNVVYYGKSKDKSIVSYLVCNIKHISQIAAGLMTFSGFDMKHDENMCLIDSHFRKSIFRSS